MENTAVLLLDVQNGAVTPQTQTEILRALDFVYGSLSEASFIVVSNMMHPANVSSIWESYRSNETDSIFAPLADALDDYPHSALIERTGESAWTASIKTILRKHDISRVRILGVNTGTNFTNSIIDITESGLKVTIVEDAVANGIATIPDKVLSTVEIANVNKLITVR